MAALFFVALQLAGVVKWWRHHTRPHQIEVALVPSALVQETLEPLPLIWRLPVLFQVEVALSS